MTSAPVWKIEVPELPAMLRKLQEFGGSAFAKKPIRKGLRYGAKLMRKTAAELAPKHDGPYPKSRLDRTPGTLKKSIKVGALKRSRSRFGVVVTSGLRGKNVNSGAAYYGHFLEKGTPRIAPRPFMRPAFDRHKDATVAAVSREVKIACERAWAAKRMMDLAAAGGDE